jgi:carbonic anhydrase
LLQKFIKNYMKWHNDEHKLNSSHYNSLAINPIQPEALIVSCCDSRILANHIFDAKVGELFIHRTIANLIPPFDQIEKHLATASVIEFSVHKLRIQDIIILGHSACAGIAALKDIDHLGEENYYLASWLSQDKRLLDLSRRGHSCKELEKKSIINSIRNLEEYPIIDKAISKSGLRIHGLWLDIGSGVLELYDAELNDFIPLATSERNHSD